MRGQETLFSSKDTTWATPKSLFETLDNVFHFTSDLAATKENTLCNHFFSLDDNSLQQDWTDLRGFLNPPYNQCKEFVEKCIEQQMKAELICLLVPSRTDTKWFHSLPPCTWIFFFRARLKFGDGKNSAPFPSCLVFFGKTANMAKSLAEKDLAGKGRWVILS